MHIGAYRAQQQGYGHPLQLVMSRKFQERGKNTWGKNIKDNAKRNIYESFSKDSFTAKLALNWVNLFLMNGL